MRCPYDIAPSRPGWSGDFYANRQALPNEHLPAAQSPKGRVLNAGAPQRAGRGTLHFWRSNNYVRLSEPSRRASFKCVEETGFPG